MPDNLSQRIADQLTQRDIDLLRVAAGDERDMTRAIDALTQELIARLARLDPTAVGEGAGQRRLDTFIDETRTVIRDAYRRMYVEERNQLVDVLKDEKTVIPDIVADELGVSQSVATTLANPSMETAVLTDIVDNRVMTANVNDAERLRGFFEREAASHHKRLAGTVRAAFAQDETLSQMVTRLRALTEMQARETAAVLRTAYNHAVNQVRVEMMGRNSPLFRGVIWISQLDSRTTYVCMSRSRGMWDLSTGQPLPASPVSTKFPGPPPAHTNCRSQLYPLTRGVREVGVMGDAQIKEAIGEMSQDQRNLLSIDPPEDETYTQWLKRQSADVQNRALGPARRKLWLDGKISLADLVTQRGRPLRLDEIQRRIRRRAA